MLLSEKILKLKREITSITISPLIEAIDIEKLKDFEQNEIYRAQLETIEESMRNPNFLHNENHKTTFSAYNEIIVFELIGKRTEIEFIKRVKGIKTPDYKIKLSDNKYVYADLKTLNFANGDSNYIEIQEQATESKIQFEKEIKKKKTAVLHSEPVTISPFKKGENEEHHKITLIIETIIEKAKAIIKSNKLTMKTDMAF